MKKTPAVETILKNLESAVAGLDQLDTVADTRENLPRTERLTFIADRLRAHANRVAPWSRAFPRIPPIYVAGMVRELGDRWQWPSGVNMTEIVERAFVAVSQRENSDTLSRQLRSCGGEDQPVR